LLDALKAIYSINAGVRELRPPKTETPPMHANLDDWIEHDAIPFSDAGVDQMMATMPDLELLGFGEALHGGEEILMLRNRLFHRLVEKHGYRAIAIESAFPQSRHVNEYITGDGDDVNFNDWISNGMGLLEANRELIEWMKQYNRAHVEKLHFYGFDMPLGKMAFGSPRLVLDPVLKAFPERRQRIESLIGDDADWENMGVIADPSKGIGLTPRATELRIEVENLVTDVRITYPGRSEALHDASVCRQLLDAHAAMARKAGHAEVLGIRDAIMADNLEFILEQERRRGKVMVFAHNSHLKRGKAEWQMGPDTHRWWPAGAHISRILSNRYAVIGTGVGVSDQNGIGEPEPGALEALFTDDVLIPTNTAPASKVDSLTTRTGSIKNPTYFPWTNDSFKDFDWLAFVKSTTYQRGGPSLEAWDADPKK
jgi:erythromycin esterase-like protein